MCLFTAPKRATMAKYRQIVDFFIDMAVLLTINTRPAPADKSCYIGVPGSALFPDAPP
jgi:hypothetical protein